MRVLFALLICSACFVGCNKKVDSNTDTATARTTTVSYVCIGMEYSERFGACAGCKLDSLRMQSLFQRSYGYNGVLLQSQQATKAAVVEAIKNAAGALPKDGLFILYYSGHGGQEDLSDAFGGKLQEPDGADELDEYLCLYDTYLLDDEIWKLISEFKCRVFLIFDACHSQTMFRSIEGDVAAEMGLGIALGEPKMVKSAGFRLSERGIALDADSLRMLCWGGCEEAEYSYGSSKGGMLTNAILKHWTSGISYSNLFEKAYKTVNADYPTQHPTQTQYGAGFEEAFR
jgi:hypothetical protein